VDFSLPRDLARTPTQASSNFITNKEQSDWAESQLSFCMNNIKCPLFQSILLFLSEIAIVLNEEANPFT